jgi:hypothetical protein
VETRHVLLEAHRRPTIVPQVAVDLPEVVLRHDREAHVLQVRRNRQGTLTAREGVVWFACLRIMGGQKSRDPPQPVLVAQGLSEGCGFPQVDEDPPELAQRIDRTAQVEAEIDGLHVGIMPLGEMLQRIERLLEGPRRFMIGRLRHGPGAGLATVGYGLAPHLTPQGMMRQPVDLVDASVSVEGFETLDNLGMQSPALFLEEAAVDNLVYQGMLKGVHRLGKGLLLIEDLGVLEDTEVLVERGLWTVHDRLEQRDRHIVTDDGGGLQQPLGLGRQAVDTRRQHGLDSFRDAQSGLLAALFQRGLRQFLQEKGISCRLSDNILEALLRQRPALGHRLHDDAARRGWERRQGYLCGHGVPCPGRRVPRPIRDQQQDRDP